MKKCFFVATLFFVLFWCLPVQASAHELKVDHDIGVELHVEPDDAPVEQNPSTLEFEITDATKKFTATSCDCTVHILQAGSERAVLPLFQQADQSVLEYVFATAGKYQVKLVGRPKGNDSFQPFSVSFDVDVSPNSEKNNVKRWIIGIGLVLFIALVIFLKKRSQKKDEN